MFHIRKWKSMKLVAAVMATALFIQVPVSYAANLSELRKSQSELNQQKDALSDSIQQKSSEIKTIQNKQDQILAQIEKLSAEMNKTNESIVAVQGEIAVANKEIAKLEEDIVYLQKKIDERTALLEERARAIQVSGTVDYIDVLLGANSFVDFIDRFSAVSTLMDADRQIMRDQKDDQLALEEQKLLLEQRKKSLQDNEQKLKSLLASLNAQKSEKNKLIDELEAEQSKLRSEKTLLEDQYSEALQLSQEVESQIIAEQRRLAAIAAQNASKGQSNSGGAAASGNLPAVAAGTWTKPTNGRFTSKFGWRDLGFGNEFHYGIDLANSTGTPIVSAADGVISYAGTMNGYGNVMMVTHSINGQIFTTVYAHLSGFSASKGQVVEKGQQIALMGNTGRSFGSHLHFEIHVGEWNGKRSNAVNPLRYINL